MDAWGILTQNSTLQTGDAWSHLNSQAGGGQPYPVLVDNLELEIEMKEYELEIETPDYSIEIEAVEYEIEIEATEMEVEID